MQPLRQRRPAKPPKANPAAGESVPRPGRAARRGAAAMPVHVLADAQIHLAPPHLGRLRQGRLKTLCGLLAVKELSPFLLAGKFARCRKCFARIDADGRVKRFSATS